MITKGSWCLLALCLLSLDLSAGIYRWVDENGRVQFSDRPPQTSETTEVKITPPPRSTAPPSGNKASTTADRLTKQQRLLDVFREEREAKKLKIKERDEKKARKADECAYAQDTLNGYMQAPFIYVPLPGGKRKILTEEEAKKEIALTRRKVKQYCD